MSDSSGAEWVAGIALAVSVLVGLRTTSGYLNRRSKDREGIRAYWQTKVVESQSDIKCELLNLYLDGNTAIVEWEAQFDDVVQNVRKRMREVAILVFEGQLIASLREYWTSERMDRRP